MKDATASWVHGASFLLGFVLAGGAFMVVHSGRDHAEPTLGRTFALYVLLAIGLIAATSFAAGLWMERKQRGSLGLVACMLVGALTFALVWFSGRLIPENPAVPLVVAVAFPLACCWAVVRGWTAIHGATPPGGVGATRPTSASRPGSP